MGTLTFEMPLLIYQGYGLGRRVRGSKNVHHGVVLAPGERRYGGGSTLPRMTMRGRGHGMRALRKSVETVGEGGRRDCGGGRALGA